jgi:hypothetical protein
MFVKPAPAARLSGSKPSPSSATSNSTASPSSRTSILAIADDPAYFETFCNASRQQKYTVASTSAG